MIYEMVLTHRLKSTLSKSETPQAPALWTDYVLDQLTPELVAGRQPAKANISTGFPAGDHIGTLQKDLAQLAADFYKRDYRSHQGGITCGPVQGTFDISIEHRCQPSLFWRDSPTFSPCVLLSRLDRGLSRLLEYPLPTVLPLYLQANRSLNTVLPAIN